MQHLQVFRCDTESLHNIHPRGALDKDTERTFTESMLPEVIKCRFAIGGNKRLSLVEN